MGPHKGTALDSLQRDFSCFVSSQLYLTAASQLYSILHLSSSGPRVTHLCIPRKWGARMKIVQSGPCGPVLLRLSKPCREVGREVL